MTELERRQVLDAIAAEVRVCTKCRLHETRTNAVPGEGDPETEVVFVGEGPGFNEDRGGRPFIGRAGDLLVKLLASIGWRREEVFITNIVKCRPPDNRDPMPDEVAACAPYLHRQLEALDPAVVVTLGRHSMARFMPGARISGAHGTIRPVDPETGARDALVFAMYHPAAALRTPAIEVESYADIAGVPVALLDARRRRELVRVQEVPAATPAVSTAPPIDATTTPAPTEPTEPAPTDAPVSVVAEPASGAAATEDRPAETTEPTVRLDPSAHPAEPSTPQLTLF